MIKVKSNLPDNRVALWDKDKRHPDGEIFMKGGESAEVEMTDGVIAAIRDGRIVQVGEVESVSEPLAQQPPSNKKKDKEKE